MQDKSKLILGSIGHAVFDELKHNKLNRHESLLAVLDLVDNPEALKKELHSTLDSYCNYARSMRL